MKTERDQRVHGAPARDHDTIGRAPGDGQRRSNANAHPSDMARHEPGAMMAEHHAMARWVQPVLMSGGLMAEMHYRSCILARSTGLRASSSRTLRNATIPVVSESMNSVPLR